MILCDSGRLGNRFEGLYGVIDSFVGLSGGVFFNWLRRVGLVFEGEG